MLHVRHCSSQLQEYKTSSRVCYCQSRRLQIYHCVQLNALFCCLWRNVEASCHKHFVVCSRKTPPPTTSDVSQLAVRWPCSTGDSVDNTWLVAALTTGTKARYRLRIAISAYPTCIRSPRQGVPVGISPPRLAQAALIHSITRPKSAAKFEMYF